MVNVALGPDSGIYRVPVDGLEGGIIKSGDTLDSREAVVEKEMGLWRDALDVEVEDQGDGGRMGGRKS